MESFHHSALLYAGPEEYAAEGSAFLRDGVRAGEPALAMVSPEKIALLREALGSDADTVAFVDMNKAGHNPAWIIPAWREFADLHPGESMRGIGEPICANRGPDELVECQHHESLLNHAFRDAAGFSLFCPYDIDALEASVIEEARRSHPHVAASGTERRSDSYRGTVACAAPQEDPLPEPHTTVHGMPFGESMIDAVRRAVERHAARAGLPTRRRADLVLAVNELAANSIRHGGGYGRLQAVGRGRSSGVRGARPRVDQGSAGGPPSTQAAPAERLWAMARQPGLRPGPGPQPLHGRRRARPYEPALALRGSGRRRARRS